MGRTRKLSKKGDGINRQVERIVMWYRYLFAKPLSFRAIICRWKGHRSGVVWYNPGGDEPDMHCRNCGDYLG